MALDRNDGDETLVAGADLTGKRYYGVKLSSGTAVVATAGVVWGVLVDENISGRAVPVRRKGAAKCIAGGNIANGDQITTDADGKFVKITPGAVSAYSLSMGQAREDAVLNDIFMADVHIPVPVPAG